MRWQDPLYLWILLIIPLLIGGIWWYQKYLKKQRAQYFEESLFSKLHRGFWKLGHRVKTISLYAGMVFLIVGVAGPKIGTQVKQVKRKGVDLLIALDMSASMNAEDVKPSRLKKAKYELSRLINRLKGDRAGLIVFTGDSYLQSPMTVDYAALHMYLNIAQTNQMPNSATDYNDAMQTALKTFNDLKENKQQSKAAKVLFIVSDGGNHGPSYKGTLKKLVKNHISVYTLGIGTQEGATIPVYNDSGKLMGYKRDQQGKVVTTKLQPKVLKQIARQGNGKYYQIGAGSQGIDAFLARLSKLQQGEFASKEYADFKNQYQLLAAIGLGFLFISLIFPDYKEPVSDRRS